MTEPQATPPPPNKRRARRRVPKGSTHAILYGNAHGLGPNLAGPVLDLSEAGLRLVVKAPLKVRQQVLVELETPARRLARLNAEVVWCLPHADGTCRAGLKFQTPMDWGALLNLSST